MSINLKTVRMNAKISFYIFFTILYINIGIGQIDSGSYIRNSYLGFELSQAIINNKSGSKSNGVFTNIISKSNIKSVISLNYTKSIIKNFNINISGRYINAEGMLNATNIVKNISYAYISDFRSSQFSLTFLPEFNIGNEIQIYIKAGLGLTLNTLSRFKNSYQMITGLDGEYTRVKRLIGLNQTKLIINSSFDLGGRLFYYNSFYVNGGLRLFTNSPVELGSKNIYFWSSNTDFYFGFAILLSKKIKNDK